jgi:hypothetical protein
MNIEWRFDWNIQQYIVQQFIFWCICAEYFIAVLIGCLRVLEIDWGAIQIDDRWEKEGEQETASESVMYDRLGLLAEDERETNERQETVR